jgi:predicted glycogen debranching enzyme
MFCNWPPRAEWLEADGQGGFASGTACGLRTRRYHALLLAARKPPTDRVVLVNGFDAFVETAAGTFPISTQNYAPDVTAPDGFNNIESFDPEPWPHWTFRLADGTLIEQEILTVVNGTPPVVLAWRLASPAAHATLTVRPFLSGRDYHSLHHENSAFNFEPKFEGECVSWQPYADYPHAAFHTNGDYRHDPHWYRNFIYEAERERGLDFIEDLASPGVFSFDLTRGEAVIVLVAEEASSGPKCHVSPLALARNCRVAEMRRRARFASPFHRAADAYLVKRGNGRTIVAGYPWFTDWGRDTFIALRGLCLATGRLDDARQILVEWSGAVSKGMLPNRFPDHGEEPEFNSVDASLWFVIAVHGFFEAMKLAGKRVGRDDARALHGAVEQILEGYAGGTRFNIHADADGLLACGVPGVQLTWMDAKVGDWVVTPRIGKPVEVQALWLNALRVSSRFETRWRGLYEKGLRSFSEKFWNEAGYLNDVVDADHAPGKIDASFRPNQIFAVGGLPISLLDEKRARRVVDEVESLLWTPIGLRSLAPGDPNYKPRYAGGVLERDGAYHQGTVWPWLLGPFVEAWVRARGETSLAKEEARVLFLCPILEHLNRYGIGHIAEVADGDEPHTPGGCPFQAWSLGELLRLEQLVLKNEENVEIGEMSLARTCV